MVSTSPTGVPELALCLVGLVGGAAMLDVRNGRIPNALLVTIAILGTLAGLAVVRAAAIILWAIAGLAAGLLIWLGPFALRWVGAADVKLVAAIGVWLGPLATFRMSLLAALAGGVMAIGYMTIGSNIRHSTFAIRHSSAVGLLPGRLSSAVECRMSDVECRTPSGMPYAMAILAGTLLELFVIGGGP